MAVSAVKKKKKVWYEVVASKEFNNSHIGEIPSFDPKKLVGKHVNVSLMNLTGNPKKQSVNIKFRISNVVEKKANTEMVGYELSNSYVRRVVRKKSSKLDDSFIVDTKDKVKLRVKPFAVTKNKVKKGIVGSIRKELKILLEKEIKEKDFSEFVGLILSDRFQKDIKGKLSKIYPVGFLEFKAIKRL